MSIFDDKYPMQPTYNYLDAFPGGRLMGGAGMTYEEAMAVDEKGKPLYPYNGGWSVIEYPARTILVGNGIDFQPVGYNRNNSYIFKVDYSTYGYTGRNLACSMTTRPFIFSTLGNVKELASLNIAYTGTGVIPNLTVYRQKDYDSPKIAVDITPYTNRDGYTQYFLREVGEYKILTFKIHWENSATAYIQSVTGVSITVKKRKERTR